jgi:hypothetical protein
MTTPGTLQATIDQILGSKTYTSAKNFVSSSATSAYTSVSSTASSYTGGDTGGYFLNTLFYFLLYSFVLFLLLILFHFTVRPVFSFVAGGKGLLQIPTGSDDKVYWNEKKQPVPDMAEARAPIEDPMKTGTTDTLTSYDWLNDFTVSLDIYVRKLEGTEPNKRVIFYKTYRYGITGLEGATFTSENTSPFSSALEPDLKSYMNGKCSMLAWLTETNDLVITLFTPDGEASCRPMKNIPLNDPFRLTVVVEKKIFTVYLNGKQTFQKVTPNEITRPSDYTSSPAVPSAPERFYPPPAWANNPKSIYVQNLHLWPRPISYAEVVSAQPALAKKEDFDLPQDVLDGKCT